jgi:starch-binding outer membrane protein, SusD/RagB family
MMNMRRHKNPAAGLWSGSGTLPIAAALAGAVALAACDLGVTNPAQVEDADLDRVEAIPALVNGVRGDFGYAAVIPGLGGVYTASAILTDELTHIGSWAPPRQISYGTPEWTEPENQSHWGFSQRARWVAEDAIRRIGNLVDNPGANPDIAMVTLYAGFSNRLLGDNFCHAVIDGGGLEDHSAFHQRALGYFTDAIAVAGAAGASEVETAAYAGRAQTHMMLGNWNEAVADAQRVPTGFSFDQPHSDNSTREHNNVHNLATRGDNGQQFSVWGTPFADWGLEVNGAVQSDGDPRAPFRVVFDADGAPETQSHHGDGPRELWYSEKYETRNTPTPIAKGTEMRLIQAEAALRGGDHGTAITYINEVRAHHNLPAASADNVDEAWEVLMRERGLELWLEGRRLADLRRWSDSPGWVATTTVRHGGERTNVLDTADDLCLKVSSNEIFSNPNIPASPYN